jgi:hypothetical protein
LASIGSSRGVGNFSGVPGETDLLLRNGRTGRAGHHAVIPGRVADSNRALPDKIAGVFP